MFMYNTTVATTYAGVITKASDRGSKAPHNGNNNY